MKACEQLCVNPWRKTMHAYDLYKFRICTARFGDYVPARFRNLNSPARTKRALQFI